MLCTGVYHTPAADSLHDGTPVMATSYLHPTASASFSKGGAAPYNTPISGVMQPVPVPQDRKLLDQFGDKMRSLHATDFERGLGYADSPYAVRRKYPNAQTLVSMAICLFLREALPRSPQPGGAVVPSSSSRKRAPASNQAGGHASWPDEASHLSHSPTQLRHAPVGVRRRHPDGAGTARPQRRLNDNDLHACVAARCMWRTEPVGCPQRCHAVGTEVPLPARN
jgi:hypothetical protein